MLKVKCGEDECCLILQGNFTESSTMSDVMSIGEVFEDLFLSTGSTDELVSPTKDVEKIGMWKTASL